MPLDLDPMTDLDYELYLMAVWSDRLRDPNVDPPGGRDMFRKLLWQQEGPGEVVHRTLVPEGGLQQLVQTGGATTLTQTPDTVRAGCEKAVAAADAQRMSLTPKTAALWQAAGRRQTSWLQWDEAWGTQISLPLSAGMRTWTKLVNGTKETDSPVDAYSPVAWCGYRTWAPQIQSDMANAPAFTVDGFTTDGSGWYRACVAYENGAEVLQRDRTKCATHILLRSPTANTARIYIVSGPAIGGYFAGGSSYLTDNGYIKILRNDTGQPLFAGVKNVPNPLWLVMTGDQPRETRLMKWTFTPAASPFDDTDPPTAELPPVTFSASEPVIARWAPANRFLSGGIPISPLPGAPEIDSVPKPRDPSKPLDKVKNPLVPARLDTTGLTPGQPIIIWIHPKSYPPGVWIRQQAVVCGTALTTPTTDPTDKNKQWTVSSTSRCAILAFTTNPHR